MNNAESYQNLLDNATAEAASINFLSSKIRMLNDVKKNREFRAFGTHNEDMTIKYLKSLNTQVEIIENYFEDNSEYISFLIS